ncbi:MAG: uroporphyrinogen decarboxylase family protein, partial [Clostridia bacterium]
MDMIKQLGLDVFSRNSYCDQNRRWFGGLADEMIDDGSVTVQEKKEGRDLVFTRTYHTRKGDLQERQRYVWEESTLVQEKFLIDDYARQLPLLEELLQARHWQYHHDRYLREQDIIGDDGIVVAGELHSPLKMLHLLMGPVETVYFITDHPELATVFMKQNEETQLDLVQQMADAGVSVMMAMDNLDTMFHPPAYVDQYCASFYEQASSICHEKEAAFFIHACGQQKDNLKLISSYGVDGLEGVAYPPLGDVELDQAMRLTGDRFIITG